MLERREQGVASFGAVQRSFAPSDDLWREIRRRTAALSFTEYTYAVNAVLSAQRKASDAYPALQRATENFVRSQTRSGAGDFLELIWSYWQEQGTLVHAMNAIARRHQSVRMTDRGDPLDALDINPLRPISNILWGHMQDEPNRLSLARRGYEYDHQYGLRLTGKPTIATPHGAAPPTFTAAFDDLLYQAHLFYQQEDTTPGRAEASLVGSALRELHKKLAEGSGNQFGDVPIQARSEMLVQQWLLAQPELADFLGQKDATPHPEAWMQSVDKMKTLHNWTDVPVFYFNELAVTGEQLLLTVRHADWASQSSTSSIPAANWARFHRGIVQRYLDALRIAIPESAIRC